MLRCSELCFISSSKLHSGPRAPKPQYQNLQWFEAMSAAVHKRSTQMHSGHPHFLRPEERPFLLLPRECYTSAPAAGTCSVKPPAHVPCTPTRFSARSTAGTNELHTMPQDCYYCRTDTYSNPVKTLPSLRVQEVSSQTEDAAEQNLLLSQSLHATNTHAVTRKG